MDMDSVEMAHDLRMPLQLIYSSAQMLKLSREDPTLDADAYADILMQSVEHMCRMLEGALERCDRACRQERPRPVNADLATCVRQLCLRCQPFAEQAGVRLSWAGNVASLHMALDEDMLSRVLLNLISNALRFTPRGGSPAMKSARGAKAAGRTGALPAKTGEGQTGKGGQEAQNARTEAAHKRLVNEIDKAVQESIRYHMVSDVEVASLLSSGVDSSYVAANFGGSKTFTVGFDYETYNEIPYAQALSKEVGIENISKIISTEEYWQEFPRIQYFMDEPLADASAAALYFVDREASKHVKVILSGEGSDELFGGYVIYHEPFSLDAYQKIPAGLRRAAAAAAEKIPGHPKGKGFVLRGAKSVEERFIGNANVFNMKQRAKVLRYSSPDSEPKKLTGPYYRRARHLSDTEKMQYIDLNFWLQGDILLKADKMSMAHGLESRVPFLDRGVYMIAKDLPLEEKISETNTKTAFREAAHRYMPAAAAEKKKLGFPVPIRIWLRQDKYYNIVKKAFCSPEAARFFHTDALMELLDAHRAGKEDYSRHIWTVYTFLVWYRQYFVEGACAVTIEDELAMEHMHADKNRAALA